MKINNIIKLITAVFIFIGAQQNGIGQTDCDLLVNKIVSFEETLFDLKMAEDLVEEYQNNGCEDMVLAYNLLGNVYYNVSNLDKVKEYLLLGEKAYFESNSTKLLIYIKGLLMLYPK